MEAIAKKPITAELMALEVGQSVEFPIEQRSSVYSIRNKIQKNLVRIPWKANLTDDLENYTIIATRVS